MPLYEFYCDQCNDKFEKLMLNVKQEVAACRLCGGGPVRRLMSICSFVADNTGDAILRKANADKDDINRRIRSFDASTLHDIYGEEKAKAIYSGAEGALSVKPLIKQKHRDVEKQFKQMKNQKKAIKSNVGGS